MSHVMSSINWIIISKIGDDILFPKIFKGHIVTIFLKLSQIKQRNEMQNRPHDISVTQHFKQNTHQILKKWKKDCKILRIGKE